MDVQSNHHAMLLLTQDLILVKQSDEPRPLSIGELAELERRLGDQGLAVDNLLDSSGIDRDPDIVGHDADRISSLLDRSLKMAVCVDRWGNRGIAAYSRNQPEYPHRLVSRMGQQAPPVIYCVGDQAALQESALAILPPRTRDQEVIEYASHMGCAMTQAGATLVSGIGKLSESALVEEAARTLAVTRGSLEKAALDRRYREPLMNGRLTLVSASDPALRQQDQSVDNLVRALAKRVFLIDSGPPPSWREERQDE